MSVLVSINGKVTSPETAVISVFDRGFLFGDGVYEAGRSYDRCFLYLDEHLARLRHSASKLVIPVPWSDEELKKDLYALSRAFGKPDVHFRMVISRGPVDHVGLDVMKDLKATRVCFVQDLPNLKELKEKGMRLLTSKIVRNSAEAQDPNIKTSNYLNSLLALQDVRARGANDGVMLDADGNVTEGTTFSLFGVRKDGTYITSPLDIGILDSITRRHVLQIGKKYFKTEEGRYSLKDFQSCEEVFIASSIREIISVSEWDEVKYPTPGPKTVAIHQKLREEIASYVKASDKF